MEKYFVKQAWLEKKSQDIAFSATHAADSCCKQHTTVPVFSQDRGLCMLLLSYSESEQGVFNGGLLVIYASINVTVVINAPYPLIRCLSFFTLV